MRTLVIFTAFMIVLSGAAAAQSAAEGQSPGLAASGAEGQDAATAASGEPEAAISTQITWRSHSIGANSSQNFLEGTACPGSTKMVSGACHPGFNDRVIITNQYPNVGTNRWRCGFRNNNSFSRTVYIYTLCAQ